MDGAGEGSNRMAAVVDHHSGSLTELLQTYLLWMEERLYWALQMQKGCSQMHCSVGMLKRLLEKIHISNLTKLLMCW